MTPKKRLKENRSLPKRWSWKHGAIYYLVPPSEKTLWEGKSWFRLGKSLAEAHKTFSEKMHHTKGAVTITMQDLLDRFEWEHLPTVKPATQHYYLYALPMVRRIFTTNPFPVTRLEPQHAYRMVDHLEKTESTKKAKQAAECLSSALSFAVKKGIIPRNPLIGQFRKPSIRGRDRVVGDQELLAFATILPRKWQLYISLKLHTKGRRKGELLRLKRTDLTTEGLVFTNNKRTVDRFRVRWTPELHVLVEEILSLHPQGTENSYLFCTRENKPYITETGLTSGFDSIWQRYMVKAVALGLCQRFTEHDLRAKAVENKSLEVAMRELRHTSAQTTQKHYRRQVEDI